MLTNAQKQLLKRAQRWARMEDEDYRDSLATVTGWQDCRSSTDPRLTDEHVDRLMRWWEWGYWQAVDSGEFEHVGARSNPFRDRNYWAAKNRMGGNSRDRWAADQFQRRCTQLESLMRAAGKRDEYLTVIRQRTGGGWKYVGALERTLRAMHRKQSEKRAVQ